ncbi:hypothetical protein [Senegalia massiliensis]|uniref:Uncharacterized protein n=1 Tax=Senegalia massiliensis TaxID=1720316 RepID=A0A845R1U7_9CLOT|nr:hypothetical protein [Senegalia massiliensis]NBI08390.1 hypothetical protein [Senegalia massiliensis]
MQITGLKILDKVLYEKKKVELEQKLKSYLGLKHDLLKDNGFKFNVSKVAYENKKLNREFNIDVVKELSTHQLVQAIKKSKWTVI